MVKLIGRLLSYSAAFFMVFLSEAAITKENKVYPELIFDPSSVKPAELIKSECRNLALDPNVKQEVRPAVPTKDIISGNIGYVVYDFRLDNSGHVKNIELVTPTSKKSFIINSQKTLENLKFSLPAEWESNCALQKYRIGYAFRIMTECTYHEFPAPIINVCSEGIIQKLN